jgi:hypothetical protein
MTNKSIVQYQTCILLNISRKRYKQHVVDEEISIYYSIITRTVSTQYEGLQIHCRVRCLKKKAGERMPETSKIFT